MADTPKPMQGTWTLTAPDGRTWQAESPLRVVAMEQRERVQATVALERIYAAVDKTPLLTADEIKLMVNRFLGWKLPPTFSPDAGISFKPYHPQQTPDSHLWPVGTNLLTADEARAMLEYVCGVKTCPDCGVEMEDTFFHFKDCPRGVPPTHETKEADRG